MATTISEWKNAHYNWPQRRSHIVRAKYEVAVLARGVGKTEGIIAPRMAHNAYALPRSMGGMVTPSFKKLFTELVPSIYTGLDKLGYEENVHYTIGKRGPSRWAIPYKRVKDWSHAMHWNCGSGLAFISQDRPSMGNGISVDYYILDEGKLIDGKRFEDNSRQAMRGNRQYFTGRSEFQSLLIVSDRPTTKQQKWFVKYRDMMDQELVKLIMQTAYRKLQLEEAIDRGDLSLSTIDVYRAEINALERDLNEMRLECTYWHEASALDNIDVIGWDNFLHMERTMDPRLFRSSILNEEVDFVEGGWYASWTEDKHIYLPAVTSFTTDRGFDRDRLSSTDSRHDAEIIPTQPLHIAMDYGGRFNCMAIGQRYEDMLRIDNGLHAAWPGTTKSVVDQFVRYYAAHKRKEVYYYYDHTALDRHGTTPFTYYDTVMLALVEAGWVVVPIDIGHTASPPRRHELFTSLLNQELPPVQWNPDNCRDMITSMRLVQIKDGPKGIAKDKSMERKGSIEDQVHAPHYSDAVDTLVWGVLHHTATMGALPTPSIMGR